MNTACKMPRLVLCDLIIYNTTSASFNLRASKQLKLLDGPRILHDVGVNIILIAYLTLVCAPAGDSFRDLGPG